MPNMIQFTRKGETEPISLQKLDEEICAVLNKPVHPEQYVLGWMDNIGWMIAVSGMTFPEIRKALTVPCDLHEAPPRPGENPDFSLECRVHSRSKYDGSNIPKYGRARAGGKECTDAWFGGDGQPDDYTRSLVPILDFLEANFTTSAWYQVGKR